MFRQIYKEREREREIGINMFGRGQPYTQRAGGVTPDGPGLPPYLGEHPMGLAAKNHACREEHPPLDPPLAIPWTALGRSLKSSPGQHPQSPFQCPQASLNPHKLSLSNPIRTNIF